MSGPARHGKAIAAATLLLLSGNAWSASEDECAGWLCIAVGFAPPQCAAAQAAMTKRLFQLKSPLPSFGSCSADGNSQGYDVETTIVAKIGTGDDARYKFGETCRYDSDNQVAGDRIPVGCTGTYRAIAVTQHGVLVGDIFFTKHKEPEKKPRLSNFDDND